MNFKSPNNQQGVALLAVLAVSVALSLLITSATVMMQRQLNIGEAAQIQFREKVAVYKKSQELAYLLATQRITRAGISRGTNSQGASRIDGRFASALTGDEIRLDGYSYIENVNGIDVTYQLQAEDGLIPINTSDQLWLKKWLRSFGMSDFEIARFADQTADYADPDSWARPAGAELFDYTRANYTQPSNFLFQQCSELFNLIKGRAVITSKAINTDECSLSRSPTININAMPQVLLRRMFGGKGGKLYKERSEDIWFYTGTEAILSLSSLNNVSDNYVSVVSKSPVLIIVQANTSSHKQKVERGVNKIVPLETRL